MTGYKKLAKTALNLKRLEKLPKPNFLMSNKINFNSAGKEAAKQFNQGFKDELKDQAKKFIKEPVHKSLKDSINNTAAGFKEGYTNSSDTDFESIRNAIDGEIEILEKAKKALNDGAELPEIRSSSPIVKTLALLGKTLVESVPEKHKENVSSAAGAVVASADFILEGSPELAKKAGKNLGRAAKGKIDSINHKVNKSLDDAKATSLQLTINLSEMIKNFDEQRSEKRYLVTAVPSSPNSRKKVQSI